MFGFVFELRAFEICFVVRLDGIVLFCVQIVEGSEID